MRIRLPGITAIVMAVVTQLSSGEALAARFQDSEVASSTDTQATASQGSALPAVAGLEAIDLSSPESVHAQRATWPHRVTVWSLQGRYVLQDAAGALDTAREKAGTGAPAAYQADLALLRGMIAIEQHHYPEARNLLEDAAKQYGKAKDTVGSALVSGYVGVLETNRNHPVKAEASLNEAIEALSDRDEKALHAWFQIALADVHLRRDQISDIAAQYQAAIDEAKEAGNSFVEGIGLKHLGIAHLARNEPELAAAKVEASIMVHRRGKQPLLEASSHRLRAICHLLRGDFNNARLEARKGVRLEPHMSGKYPPARTSEGFFWRVYQWKGEFKKTLEYMDRALHRAEADGDQLLQAHLHLQRALAWAEMGHVLNATTEFDAASVAYREVGDQHGWIRLAAPRLEMAYQAGDLEKLETLAQKLTDDPWTAAQPRDASVLYENLGTIWNKLGETDKAVASLDKAIAAAETVGDPLRIADLNEQAGEVLEAADRDTDAVARYEKAWEIVRDLEDPQWIPFIARKLDPLYKAADRKKDAKKVTKAAKPFKDWVWTPLLRPPTMPLASGTEMIRWMLVMQRFGDMGALGRARTYQLRYNVNKQYNTYNDYLGDFEEIVAAFKATGNVVGIMQPTDILVRVLIATDGWDEARSLREDQLNMAHEKGFYSLEHTYLSHAIDEYYEHDEVDKALAFAQRGIELARETGNRWNEVDMLLDLGDMQAEQKASKDALSTGKAALAIAESLHDPYRTFYALGVLTAAARAENDTASAEQFKTRALAMVKDLHLDDDDMQSQMKASNVYKLLGDYDEAIACLKKAIDAIPKGSKGVKEVKENLGKKIKDLEALRDGKKAD